MILLDIDRCGAILVSLLRGELGYEFLFSEFCCFAPLRLGVSSCGGEDTILTRRRGGAEARRDAFQPGLGRSALELALNLRKSLSNFCDLRVVRGSNPTKNRKRCFL